LRALSMRLSGSMTPFNSFSDSRGWGQACHANRAV